MNNIGEWLASLDLEEYCQRFVENGIDLTVLGDLTDQDLKELGVLLGHRRKMLRAIRDFAARSTSSASEPTPREAERRQLTVMFCDLVGSTALSAQLDPEDMRRLIGAYHACITDVVTRHQGLIARYMGDGVLVYFGYPQAHEDDADQAVRAGLALVDAITRLPVETGATLTARIGIATGVTVVGDLIGEGAAQEQAVVGETPNLAARLQTLAKPGCVVICARTRRLTGGNFEYRSLGLVALKGWTEPLQVWQVVGSSEVASSFEAKHRSRLTPLLGRDEEIELLLRRWRQAVQSQGRVVMLTGEPGIGKSHIALALEERLKAESHVYLRYFCSPHHTNSALFPFIGQLERAARFERSDSPAEKLAKLEALLGQHASHSEHTLGLLADILSLPTNDRFRVPELAPQKRKEMTLAAFSAQLSGLARQQPALMVFEDVHWIDPTSLDLLAMVVEQVQQLRVLVLITARPEFTPPWPGHSHVTTIPLTRLSRDDGAALVERVTDGKTLPEELMNQILAHTDGVPLFIEELTKTVLETGLLHEEQGHYVLDQPLPQLAIPTTLHASLMARLDRLAPVREVAQIGAVVGREFSYELLSTVAGLSRERLADALKQLVRAELVFQRGEIPHAVYRFKHALVRDAAYSGLLRSRRAELHAAIAGAFERQFPDVVETQPEILAHHLTEAGLVKGAVAYWLKAGKSAAMRSANLEAVAHLQRGVEVLNRLPDDPGKHRLELDLQVGLAPCLIATQGPASRKAVATFARARELCEHLGDPPEYLQVMFWLATASVVRGELPQALDAIAALHHRADARGDRPALLNAIRGQAMILLFMGQIADAHAVIERAIEAFDASSETDKLAARAAGQDAGVANLALMSWVLWLRGDVDTAVAQSAAAFARVDAIGDPHTRAYACYYASILHALRGEPQIALGHADRCLALSDEHGFRQWRGLSRAVRGICLIMLEPASGVIEEVKAAMDEYRHAGYQLGITALHVLMGSTLLLRRESECAQELIEQGLSIARNNSERIFEAELCRLEARALLARGGSDSRSQAETLLNAALSTARNQHARSLELRAATDLAALWADAGLHREALNLLSSVLAGFTEGFDTQDLKNAKLALDQLQPSPGRHFASGG